MSRVVPLRTFGRAILLRCPRCGGGSILRNWFTLKESCGSCGLRFDRGESHDFWLGAFAINLVVALACTVIVAMALLLHYWPNSGPAMWGGGAAVLIAPLAFYPLSRTLWLAWDLTFRRDEDAG